jgi:hypothetical protein
MKKHITLILILFSQVILFSQTKIYKGDSESTFDCLYTISDEKIYEGDSESVFDILYTIKNNGIYDKEERSFSQFNRLVSFKGLKIYKGSSTMHFDEVTYTIIDNKVYKGNSNGSTFDCVYTYEDGKLYEGDSTSVFDLLYTIKGFVSLSQIAGLLLLV